MDFMMTRRNQTKEKTMNDSKNQDITRLSIEKLFDSQDKYIIPIYQRNYAWGEQEVAQLIDDIHRHERGKYYLGSLTVKKRDDGFEVIDGQQRLTTLFLLLSVLGHSFGLDLSFEHREDSSDELNVIKQGGDFKDKKLSQITMVYRYLKDNGKKLFNRDDKNQKSFLEKLLSQVQIIRTEIPENTDLNQYFERMNNRGEQLEQHEVIKAKLMSELKDDDRAIFSAVWNACSDMSRYAVSSFSADERHELFYDKDKNEYFWLYENFGNLKKNFQKSKKKAKKDKVQNENSYPSELGEILSTNFALIKNDKPSQDTQYERFTSIIDFPNFLAQVLYLYVHSEKWGGIDEKIYRLDAVNLNKQFEQSCLYNNSAKIRKFAVHLLNIRLLFDRHVIKYGGLDGKDDWRIYQFKKSDKNHSSNYHANVFGNVDQDKQIKMLQTMFHYSFPAKNYKYWLFAYLKWLNDESRERLEECKESGCAVDLPADEHIEFLEKLCDKFYFNRFYNDGKGDDYFHLIYKDGIEKINSNDFLNKGTAVENFIFNRLDYILWKKQDEPNELKMGDDEDFKKKVGSFIKKNFKFTARNSVEHYYPQNPIRGGLSDELAKVIDSFGNLCLITHSQNSSLGNKMPSEKKAGYDVKRYSLLSLKQQRMFEYNAETWGAKEIMEHGEQMIRLLNQPISKIDAAQSDA